MEHRGLQTWFGKPLATYQVDAGQWRAGRSAAKSEQ
jgi:hypothetical protein